MTVATEVATLLKIADRAVQVSAAEILRREARSDLVTAYMLWKINNGIQHVDRDTPEWAQMMEATKPEFDHWERAKRAERNARKRLSDAVLRSGAIGRAS